MRSLVASVILFGAFWTTDAAAQRWQDASARCLGTTAQWSNDIDVADVDGDGKVDILVANGPDYDTPGTPEATRVWKNNGAWAGAGACTEISAQAVMGYVGLSRVIKAIDLDNDGDLDIVTGGAYNSQLRLFLRDNGTWIDGTDHFPQQATAVHDVEHGDVDGDGDLDLLISDTGAINPGSAGFMGGRTKLYLNDGTGRFTDATTTNMPDVLVRWSWDVELVDIDNDWDLDALISCKRCTKSYVFRNDGTGKFTDDPAALPTFTNNYEFEAMDFDGDGDMDLMSLNDGGGLRDIMLANDGTGKFTDESATRIAGTANPAADDNAVVWLDADSDGDADLFVASLSGPDRLLINDGHGVFTLSPNSTPNDTSGSLAIALADLDGDGRLDLVQAQGEQDFDEKVQLATDMIAVDTSAPKIVATLAKDGKVYARIHDYTSPVRPHDWQRVWIDDGGVETPLVWYGEYLWRANVTPGASFRVCAKDRMGNQSCTGADGGDGVVPPDGDTIDPPGGGGGGCCDARGSTSNSALFGLVLLLAIRRRR